MFPPEIFGSVFDILNAQGKMASLATFSAVSRDFHFWVQNLVFQTVKFTIKGDPISEVQALRFEHAVVGNPRLAKVVKSLRLDLANGWREGTILPFLKVLTELDSFVIRFPYSENDTFAITPSWSLLSRPLRIVLERIMVSPKLVELDLQAVDFPIREFFRFSTVKKLRLHRVTDSTNEFVQSTSLATPTADLRLQTLDITPYFGAELLEMTTPDGHPRFEWTALRSVTIYLFFLPLNETSNVVQLPRQILSNALRLEELSLCGLRNRHDWSFSYMHPSAYKTFTRLNVQCELLEEEADPYMGISESLRTLPEINALAKIQFGITVRYRNRWTLDTQRWSKLADIWEHQVTLPALERVIVHVTVACEKAPLGEGEQGDVGRLEGYIQALKAVNFGNIRDKIHFEFKVESRVKRMSSLNQTIF